jgi:hypothetical protein
MTTICSQLGDIIRHFFFFFFQKAFHNHRRCPTLRYMYLYRFSELRLLAKRYLRLKTVIASVLNTNTQALDQTVGVATKGTRHSSWNCGQAGLNRSNCLKRA